MADSNNTHKKLIRINLIKHTILADLQLPFCNWIRSETLLSKLNSKTSTIEWKRPNTEPSLAPLAGVVRARSVGWHGAKKSRPVSGAAPAAWCCTRLFGGMVKAAWSLICSGRTRPQPMDALRYVKVSVAYETNHRILEHWRSKNLSTPRFRYNIHVFLGKPIAHCHIGITRL